MTRALLDKLSTRPEQVSFEEVMETIARHYHYTPTRFSNGKGDHRIDNAAGSNEGSCKIFAFARLHQLSEAQTLACFGQYYRGDVLAHPEGTDHANIRTFMKEGWRGIHFDQNPLTSKV